MSDPKKDFQHIRLDFEVGLVEKTLMLVLLLRLAKKHNKRITEYSMSHTIDSNA